MMTEWPAATAKGRPLGSEGQWAGKKCKKKDVGDVQLLTRPIQSLNIQIRISTHFP